MKQTKFIIGLLLLFSINNLTSQNIESGNIKRIYEIDFDGFQKVRLVKTKKNRYKGMIINYIYKHGFIRRKISKRIKIDTELAKHLMIELFNAKMDTLKRINCWELLRLKKINQEKFGECMDNNDKSCLDGDSSFFTIKIGKFEKEYGFDCLSPKEKIKPNTPKYRKHALILMKIIDNKINLEGSLKKFFSNLRKGNYDYYGLSTLEKQ